MKISNRKEKNISAKHLLYSLAITEESSGEQILRTKAGILLGFGCIKIVDCTRNHFSGDILRAKSLFSMRWKIGKLLGTIAKGGIA